MGSAAETGVRAVVVRLARVIVPLALGAGLLFVVPTSGAQREPSAPDSTATAAKPPKLNVLPANVTLRLTADPWRSTSPVASTVTLVAWQDPVERSDDAAAEGTEQAPEGADADGTTQVPDGQASASVVPHFAPPPVQTVALSLQVPGRACPAAVAGGPLPVRLTCFDVTASLNGSAQQASQGEKADEAGDATSEERGSEGDAEKAAAWQRIVAVWRGVRGLWNDFWKHFWTVPVGTFAGSVVVSSAGEDSTIPVTVQVERPLSHLLLVVALGVLVASAALGLIRDGIPSLRWRQWRSRLLTWVDDASEWATWPGDKDPLAAQDEVDALWIVVEALEAAGLAPPASAADWSTLEGEYRKALRARSLGLEVTRRRRAGLGDPQLLREAFVHLVAGELHRAEVALQRAEVRRPRVARTASESRGRRVPWSAIWLAVLAAATVVAVVVVSRPVSASRDLVRTGSEWWLIAVGTLVVAAIVLRLLWRVARDWWPSVRRMIAARGYGLAHGFARRLTWLLSFGIATLVIVAVNYKPGDAPWGTRLDLLVAFMWGITAHGLVEGLADFGKVFGGGSTAAGNAGSKA